jgi:hypothetical protein
MDDEAVAEEHQFWCNDEDQVWWWLKRDKDYLVLNIMCYDNIDECKGHGCNLPGLRPVPINRWTVTPYCSCWIVITLSHPHLQADRMYQCNINSVNIHVCFMEYKYEWIIELYLSSSRIPIYLWNDEDTFFMTFGQKIIISVSERR